MITILTPRFLPFFLLLWIIGAPSYNTCNGHQLTRVSISPANVSVSVFPSQLLPSIYRYGYAMPFYNVQQTVRAVVFGTRNQSTSLPVLDSSEIL